MDVNETGRPETAPAQVGALGPTVDVQTAARLLGIGRTTAYQLASRNALPVPVVRIGWPDAFIEHGKVEALWAKYGLTAEAALQKARPYLTRMMDHVLAKH